MVATIKLEKSVTYAGVLEIVIGKLRHWLEPCLVVMLPIYKGIKVSFYCAILSFCFPVRLKVKCGRKLSLYAKEVTEQRPEFGRENRSPVTNDGVQEAMILHQHVNNHLCPSCSINSNFDWLVMHHVGQAINNDKNQVITMVFPVSRKW